MVSESVSFGTSTLGIVVGLAILLYGVSLNSGQSLNAVVLVGGVVILAGFAILTASVAGLDGGH